LAPSHGSHSVHNISNPAVSMSSGVPGSTLASIAIPDPLQIEQPESPSNSGEKGGWMRLDGKPLQYHPDDTHQFQLCDLTPCIDFPALPDFLRVPIVEFWGTQESVTTSLGTFYYRSKSTTQKARLARESMGFSEPPLNYEGWRSSLHHLQDSLAATMILRGISEGFVLGYRAARRTVYAPSTSHRNKSKYCRSLRLRNSVED